MSAYIIANVDVRDTKAYDEYRAQVPATVKKYGGEFIVRGGKWESLEGEPLMPRLVVLKFPSVEQAKAWYNSPEYDGPKKLRQSASKGNVVVVEGFE